MPIASASEEENAFKWTTFHSELEMSKELRGVATWLLKSTYCEDVQNSALHTESQGGIGKSWVYTQCVWRS